LVANRQFETSVVKAFLKTGCWPMRPNRHNWTRRNGPRTAKARKVADDKVMRLMAKKPLIGVRQLAHALNLTHPTVSRRIMRMKELGLVDHGPNGWEVETAQSAQCAPWVSSVSKYLRQPVDGLLPRYG
jgi:hypothetical protein